MKLPIRHIPLLPLLIPILLASCQLGDSQEDFEVQSAETRACRAGDVDVCIELCDQGDERACTRVPEEADCSSVTKADCRAGDTSACQCLCDAGDQPACDRITAPPVLDAELVYENDFESDWGVLDFQPCFEPYPFSFELDRSLARSGQQSARVENPGNQTNDTCSDTSDGKHRAEMAHGDRETRILYSQVGVDTWFGFSMFVPEDYPGVSPVGSIVTQLNGGKSGPEFEMIITGDATRLSFSQKSSDPGGQNGLNQSLGKVPLIKGRWVDFVILRRRSFAADGVTRIWMDGTIVVDEEGPNAVDYEGLGNAGTLRLKNGIYWGTADKGPSTFVLYFDSVKIATGPDGYDLVAPQ